MKQREFLSNLMPSYHVLFERVFQALDRYELSDYLTDTEKWFISNWSVSSHRWNNLVILIGIWYKLLKQLPKIYFWLERDLSKHEMLVFMAFCQVFYNVKFYLNESKKDNSK